MIPNSVVVAAGKGGVGKTTLATHLAGVWAAEGRRPLLVALDPQTLADFVREIRGASIPA